MRKQENQGERGTCNIIDGEQDKSISLGTGVIVSLSSSDTARQLADEWPGEPMLPSTLLTFSFYEQRSVALTRVIGSIQEATTESLQRTLHRDFRAARRSWRGPIQN